MRLSVYKDILVRASNEKKGLALWCLPGFADSGLAFSPLHDTEIVKYAQIFTPDLPGFGASPKKSHASTIEAYVETLIDLVREITPDRDVGFVGHSVGSVLATEAAHKLQNQCTGVVSIEGNLTAEDAYFSGQAVNFEAASEFKKMFTDTIWGRGAEDGIFRAYFSGLKQADETAMWLFGKDVKKYSAHDHPGKRVLALECPFSYLWCAENTPPTSQKFLRENNVENVELTGTSHWPMIDASGQVAQHLTAFFS